MTLDDIRRFRQLDSKCPGHPEYQWSSGVETTTGPLGQGLATSVGMAITGRRSAARYQARGFLTAAAAEKSGQHEFEFEYGDDYAHHIEAFLPTFCKVLVRYSTEGDEEMNRRQAKRLRRLSACSERRVGSVRPPDASKNWCIRDYPIHCQFASRASRSSV